MAWDIRVATRAEQGKETSKNARYARRERGREGKTYMDWKMGCVVVFLLGFRDTIACKLLLTACTTRR